MSLEKRIRSFLKGPRKGETYELKGGLVSQYKWERKDAIQRVIQAMTVGKDVLALFPDVLKNIATYDIEQKKLVYLYLMNYAKLHPELCILAVNTFVTDTEDPNPLIRALAIRTMGCIRVDRMVDYMEIPLQRTLKDDNPYVRKTAAICVAKLFDLNPEMCVEFGFLDALKGLINDSNPMVVSNALSAIYEIRDANEDASLDVFSVDDAMIKNLLHCLNECTEWGRITILTTLTDYQTSDREEIIHIVERVVPQLQHVNPSVVLLSIKAILHHLESYPTSTNQDQFKQNTLKKLSAPLVSLVSISVPEAQYVGLKNIRIILEKYPFLLQKELRVFFIRYLDPLYLKLEKLEILVRLANELNSAILLAELKEYSMEFEPALVSKAIKCIGSVAVKLPSMVVKAVHLLSNLVDQRPDDLVVNQTVVVLVNILRRYPGRNDLTTLVVPVILNHSADLTANDALSSYIWLLGECPKYFRDAETIGKLTEYVTEFLQYESILQLDILTTIVKINLERPGHPEFLSLLQKVLEAATQGCENADVRDRAYIYWRLLSLPDSESVQKRVVLSKLPPIKSTISTFNPAVLDTLVAELSTVSSVFQKPALTFISKNAYKKLSAKSSTTTKNLGQLEDLTSKAKQEIINNSKNENLLDFDDDEGLAGATGGTSGSLLDELNDLFLAIPQQQQQQQQEQRQQQQGSSQGNLGSNQDILSLFGTSGTGTGTNTDNTQVTAGINNLNLGTTGAGNNDKKSNSNDLLDLF